MAMMIIVMVMVMLTKSTYTLIESSQSKEMIQKHRLLEFNLWSSADTHPREIGFDSDTNRNDL